MSAPMPPCKGCSLRQVKCKSDCERWAIYEKEKKAWKDVVTVEKNRYFNLIEGEIQRKAKEKDRKRRRERR